MLRIVSCRGFFICFWLVGLADALVIGKKCIREEGPRGRKACVGCYNAKKKCVRPSLVDRPGPSEAGTSTAIPPVSSTSTTGQRPVVEVRVPAKRHRSRSSLEALRDIADAVRDLKADKQYSSFETRFAALESRVDALAAAFEAEMVIRAEKEKGKDKVGGEEMDSDEEMDQE